MLYEKTVNRMKKQAIEDKKLLKATYLKKGVISRI